MNLYKLYKSNKLIFIIVLIVVILFLYNYFINKTIEGNLTVLGNTTVLIVLSVTVSFGDTMIQLNANILTTNGYTPLSDFGFYGQTTIGGSRNYAGIAYDNSANAIITFRTTTIPGIEINDIKSLNEQKTINKESDILSNDNEKEILDKFPNVLRRVGGYNIDLIDPNGFNSSNLLVGSEGTLSLIHI